MGEDSEPDDAGVRESVDSFRQAGSAMSDGLRGIYDESQAWVNRRHLLVQFAIGILVWFVANWTYNRITPPIVTATVALTERMSSAFPTDFLFGIPDTSPVLASVQILTALLAIVVAQNRMQTQKLKEIEVKVTTMTTSRPETTDGGTPERRPTVAWAVGLAIAGGSIGFSFGPGGVLAGIYFGLLVGGKIDRRGYDRDSPSTNLNVEPKAER